MKRRCMLLQTLACTPVHAVRLVLVVLAAACGLRALLAQDAVL